jgi:hypothetical protein
MAAQNVDNVRHFDDKRGFARGRRASVQRALPEASQFDLNLWPD